jgi:hypothetical protein
MRSLVRLASCVVVATGALFVATAAFAQQRASNSFPFGTDRIDLAQLVPAEPTPESPLPEHPVLPDRTQQRTGGPAVGAPSDDLCHCVGDDSSTSAVARIRAALRAPLKEAGLNYVDQPLEEVVNLLQEEYGIPIKFDTAALKELGVETDQPVTVNLRGISLGAALRLLLNQLGLTYAVHNEVLMITTPDAEEVRLQTCVYDVRDLLQQGQDFDSLIDAIVACVATQSWAENGGDASEIRPLPPGFLIISQTAAVHDEIRGLLGTIRRMASRSAPTAASRTGFQRASDGHDNSHRGAYGSGLAGRRSETNQPERTTPVKVTK